MTDNFKELNDANLPVIRPQILFLILAAVVMGTLMAAIYIPAWQPALAVSIVGDSPKAYWFLSRGSALVAYGLLWSSMVFGLVITNRLARIWPGGPTAFDLHQFISILGLAFALFHGLILLGDHFVNFKPAQILVPFTTLTYKPLWVGLGQLAFYLWVLITVSFYVRKSIGGKTWRWIHYFSYLTFALALFHGIASGTDTATPWAGVMYWFSGFSLFFLLIYRLVLELNKKPQTRASLANDSINQRTSKSVWVK
jgi:predicted ferric reductase